MQETSSSLGKIRNCCFQLPDWMFTKMSCRFRMSTPAADILQKFYLKLRDRNTSADGTPITARQLESLVRLAEARAKLDLREEITVQDALVVKFI